MQTYDKPESDFSHFQRKFLELSSISRIFGKKNNISDWEVMQLSERIPETSSPEQVSFYEVYTSSRKSSSS